MKKSDEELVARCLKKDQRAYKELYERYAGRMYGVCLRYCRGTAAAEDVLHDGFIKVFESLHKLKDVRSLSTWIQSIMIHTAINSFLREQPVMNNEKMDEVLSDQHKGSTEIYDMIDIELILAAIAELPRQYQIVFNLCAVEEYERTAVAKMLNISEETVRSNLFRARKLLAKKLKPLLEEKNRKQIS